jgi:hypothetical protein
MALPKKDRRKITVDGHPYFWIASGNDDFIHLIICSANVPGQKLLAQFNYHSFRFTTGNLKQTLSITPFIVRQVIQYGINSGWTPEKRSSELWLGFLDNKIDLKLNPET